MTEPLSAVTTNEDKSAENKFNEEIIEITNTENYEQQEEDDQEPLNIIDSFNTNEEEITPRTMKTEAQLEKNDFAKKLKKIKKQAGLLDDPSNLLDIGTAYYYNNKKMENLTKYSEQLQKKKKYQQNIIKQVEDVFTTAYDDVNIPQLELNQDKKHKIASAVMKMKLLELAETEKLLFPFLD